MRIAILFEFGTLNGGEHSMLAAVDRLRGDGHDFVALAPADGRLAAALAERGIRHVPFDIRESGVRRPVDDLLAAIDAVIRATEPDLVHANSLSMARWTGAWCRARPRRSLPVTGHLRDIVNLSAAAIRDLNGNDRLVAVSRATQRHHVERGLNDSRVTVLHNGVDTVRFQPRPASGVLRRELDLPCDAVIALAIGQIGLRKGLDTLAEAVVALADPRLHVILVGERLSTKAESIAFERSLVERFAASGMGERLHRVGYRSDIPFLLNEADLLVHAAKQEPLGRVLLEAAASGTPIVATNVGGTPEILDEQTAILVPPADPAALAAGIRAALDDEDARQDRARAARLCIEANFTIEQAAERLGRFWCGMCDRNRQQPW